MQLGLLLIFAALPFLEIALLIAVGEAIGLVPTIGLLVLSAAFGSYVVYEQGFQVMGRATDAIGRGKTPLAPVIDGMFVLLGGALLILPGFISDVLGLALLVPPLRHRFAVWSLRRILRSGHMRTFGFGTSQSASGAREPGGGPSGGFSGDRGPSRPAQQPPEGSGPIIEGEFERLGETTVDSNRRQRPPDGHG
jgi:UPF0716 protein FxsA